MLSHFRLISTVKVSRDSLPLQSAHEVDRICEEIRVLFEKSGNKRTKTLDAIEFEEILKEVIPNITSSHCQAMFHKLDKEKTGKVAYNELLRTDTESRFRRILLKMIEHEEKKHSHKRNSKHHDHTNSDPSRHSLHSYEDLEKKNRNENKTQLELQVIVPLIHKTSFSLNQFVAMRPTLQPMQ